MSHELAPLGSGAMFDAIAPRYDLLNRIISFGIDRRWRRLTIDALALPTRAALLDVATGTADLALLAAERHGDAYVTGLDPSPGMLAIGRQKAHARGLTPRVDLVPGDAQALPFPDASFDGACIGFGIRNVPDRARALAEMARVLKPGARLAVLELSEPRGGLLGRLARLHVHHFVPWLGGLLSGSREYRYLQRSIAAFPPPEEFAGLMRAAGLVDVVARPLTFGVCHLYVGARGRG
jgi:demethylmenaquinone methyltransferase/2-methoxy-6-polyprenyl-1,4-benzoquinol methylase